MQAGHCLLPARCKVCPPEGTSCNKQPPQSSTDFAWQHCNPTDDALPAKASTSGRDEEGIQLEEPCVWGVMVAYQKQASQPGP